MVSAFWRSISVGVVKQLQSKPQIAQLLSELIGIDLADLLKVTQKYTIPYLILWKKVELVERIAQACEKDVWSLIYDNMSEILVLLLAQDADSAESTTKALLENVCAGFKNVTLVQLVWPLSISIAAELLKAAGDEDDDRKTRVR